MMHDTVRVLEFDIGSSQDGMTIREFLKNTVKLSNRQISSLKYREDGIVLNGSMVRVTCVLHEHDRLAIGLKTAGNLYLDHGTFTDPPDILYEDADLLIVNKPAGMVCHPSPGHYADSLANQAAAYAAKKGEDWTIRIIGRLDKDTSGIVIFAKNSESAAILEKQKRDGSLKKTYLALIKGVPETDEGTVDVPIAPDDDMMGKMKADINGKSAVTHFKVLKRYDNGTSLVTLSLEHGRTHQIRVHMAYLGFPLVGDGLYGDGEKGKTRAMLQCSTISLRQPFSGKEIALSLQPDTDFTGAARG